jgi:hypothetical protein
MMRIHESFQAHRKKVIIISVAGLILVALIAGYVWMSSQAWQSSEQTSVARKTTVITLTKDVLYNGNISNTERATKLKKLSEIKTDDLCKVSGLYSWQRSLIGSLEATMKHCESVRNNIATVVAAANTMQRYSSDEKKIIVQLQNLKPVTDKISTVDLKKTVDTLQRAKDQVTKASLTTEDGKELRTLSVDILTAAATSWNALVTANEKQDRAAYEAETTKLASAYGRFSEVSKQSADKYQKHLGTLQTALVSLAK